MNNSLPPGDVKLLVRPRAPQNSAGPHPTVGGILDIGHSITAPHKDIHLSGEGSPTQIRESRCKIAPLLALPLKPRRTEAKVKKFKAKPKPPNPKELYLIPCEQILHQAHRLFL